METETSELIPIKVIACGYASAADREKRLVVPAFVMDEYWPAENVHFRYKKELSVWVPLGGSDWNTRFYSNSDTPLDTEAFYGKPTNSTATKTDHRWKLFPMVAGSGVGFSEYEPFGGNESFDSTDQTT